MLLRSIRCLRNKRRTPLPKAYDTLGAASVGQRWWKISDHTEAARREVATGAWADRSAPEATYLPSHQREAEVNGMPTPSNTAEEDATAAGGPYTDGAIDFKTREEAEAFFNTLEQQDETESKVPVLDLAKGFFDDLAKTASEELDTTEAPETKSDAERQEEAYSIQREFFADYYVTQQCVPEGLRNTFLETMTSPPVSCLATDPNRILSRITVRQQLERHALDVSDPNEQFFFPVSWVDGAFAVGGDPWPVISSISSFGSDSAPVEAPPRTSLREDCTADASSSAQWLFDVLNDDAEAPGGGVNRDDHPALCEEASMSAEALFDDMVGEQPSPSGWKDTSVTPPAVFLSTSPPIADTDATPPAGVASDDLQSGQVCSSRRDVVAVFSGSRTMPVDSPPDLRHLHWMQRVIGCGTAIDMDVMGLLVPLLLDVQQGDVVLAYTDVGETEGNGRAAGNYTEDIVRHLRHNAVTDAFHHTIRASHTIHPRGGVLLLQRPLATQHSSSRNTTRDFDRHQPEDEAEAGQHPSDITSSASSASTNSSRVCEHVAVVRLPHRNAMVTMAASSTGSNTCIASILCAPRTTGDGIRPRVVLGSDEHAEKRCPAHRSMSLIARAGSGFLALRNKLLYGLRTLRHVTATTPHSSAPRRPLRLVYAVNSMNPLECEAIVASALQLAAQDRQDDKTPSVGLGLVPVHDALGMATPQEAAEVFCGLEGGWGNGLTTWMSVEGAPKDSEPDATPIEVRSAVAASSWRLRPSSDRTNGGYLCVIEAVASLGKGAESRLSNASASRDLEEDEERGEAFAVVHGPSLCSEERRMIFGSSGRSSSGNVVLIDRALMDVVMGLRLCRPSGSQRMELVGAGLPVVVEGGLLDRSLSATLAAEWLMRRWHRVEPMLPLPPSVQRSGAVVSVHAELMMALLYTRCITSHGLRDAIRVVQQRCEQQTSGSATRSDQGADGRRVPLVSPHQVVIALRRFQDEMDRHAVSSSSDGRPTPPHAAAVANVWLTVCGWCWTEQHQRHNAPVAALHPQVEAEMEGLAIATHLECTSGGHWVLRLSRTPAVEDSSSHLGGTEEDAAMEERLVGARDALQYVGRLLLRQHEVATSTTTHTRTGNDVGAVMSKAYLLQTLGLYQDADQDGRAYSRRLPQSRRRSPTRRKPATAKHVVSPSKLQRIRSQLLKLGMDASELAALGTPHATNR